MEQTLPWVVRELPPPGSLDLWLLRVSDVPLGILDEQVLDATERQRAATLMHAADRTRFTAAHVALRRLLGSYLSLRPEEVHLGRDTCPCCGGPHGRPTVLDADDRLFFSLSHRGDLAVVGTAAAPIGVDVELVPDEDGTADLAAMLHVDEQAELAALSPPPGPGPWPGCGPGRRPTSRASAPVWAATPRSTTSARDAPRARTRRPAGPCSTFRWTGATRRRWRYGVS